MKTLMVACLLSLGMTCIAHADAKCSVEAPFKYRVVGSYEGGYKRKGESGTFVQTGCLEREIKTQADYDWLTRKLEVKPKVTKVMVLSATRLAD